MRALILFLLLLLALPAQAQTGGQFCVRAFDDLNGNGILESGEALISNGISADLLNSDQIVIASALLSESPTALQGVICFQMLAQGQYSLVVTAAEYTATTPNMLTASISDGNPPTVMEFGARRLDQSAEVEAAPVPQFSDRETLARLVLSGLGTLVAVAAMVVLGALIYLFVVRPRPQAEAPLAYAAPVPSTDEAATPTPGTTPRVDVEAAAADTDEIPAVE
jgi:hypothetical protein